MKYWEVAMSNNNPSLHSPTIISHSITVTARNYVEAVALAKESTTLSVEIVKVELKGIV